MKDYFHGGITDYILFYGWKNTTEIGFVFSCLACFFLGFLYEWLKSMQTNLKKNADKARIKNEEYSQIL